MKPSCESQVWNREKHMLNMWLAIDEVTYKDENGKESCHARHEEEEEQDKDRFYKYYKAN
jgi:hypothetical protein